LRHPKFWNNEASCLSKKQRSRNRTRKNSVSNIGMSYLSASDNASDVSSQKKKSKAYISKKKVKQMQEEDAERKRKQEEEILRQEREEEEWRQSKHIQQLEHMADICEDYNYIVD
jgi:hypothetical protein